ncbi:glutathione S-transferase family protein [Pseudophaeobacter sp.]|uniref:glutathione S-transferase family protein n=1 Tax=Pseudophaeobacter sp. TaxID=1971739 RepID=UPI00329A17EC
MGLLQDGKWVDQWYDTKSTAGRFKRVSSSFRNWITPDGSAGPSGEAGFQAEAGRYHLYVSNACPWAHRTILMRSLKGLEDMVSMSVTHWKLSDQGWSFHASSCTVPDSVNGAEYLHQVYTAAQSDFSGRVTVPVLWDKKTKMIVSNESAEIMRMFNSAFDYLGATPTDYYPVKLREEINAINARIYTDVGNGVYKAGFATSQAAYEEAVVPLFETLDWLDDHLSRTRYLVGSTITEADWRLFTTLIRFDIVYFGHFKCNIRRIEDYENLSGYLRDLFQQPGVAETVNIEDNKNSYYASHSQINPTLVVPLGPKVDLSSPHNRQRVSQ